MRASSRHILIVSLTVAAMVMASLVLAQKDAGPHPDPGSATGPRASKTARGSAAIDKLSMELQILYRQFSNTRGAKPGEPRFSGEQLSTMFGIKDGRKNPAVEVALKTSAAADTAALEKTGAKVRLRAGDMVYATVPVLALQRVAQQTTVTSIEPLMGARLPKPPGSDMKPQMPRGTRGGSERLANEFDRQTLTGRGVIIADIDTGIDWTHQDFVREDGTSRILYLYDLFDNSWASSGGRIGSEPPLVDTSNKPIGTLYTNAQISAALHGQGTVASKDFVGHGTATAGTAAGNGRAGANGVSPGTYKGVAPEADLIIVKADDGSGGISGLSYYTVDWIFKTAKSLGEPCVINMSFGSQWSSHEGEAAPELLLDDFVGAGKSGAAISVSAGNEGRDSFHAGGTFGPNRPGQADIFSEGTELFISGAKDQQHPEMLGAILNSYFSASDDWGLAIVGLDNFFVDETGQPDAFFLRSVGGTTEGWLAKPTKAGQDFKTFFRDNVEVKPASERTSRAGIWLPQGKYMVWGFGPTANVTSGRFDLYIPDSRLGSFGKGNEARFMVGSPGNATNVITVGAYDFRNTWANITGTETFYNMKTGTISSYSSPGFRRDNVVKPEIAAPATYTISPLSKDSQEMGRDRNGNPDKANITTDGFHLAWAGTSASSPFTAGVIALMFQKNPTLDEAQIKEILKRTATKDSLTGATPNPHWGYGKLNPAAAIAATPSAR